MLDIDFFDYPDMFAVTPVPWESTSYIYPFGSFYFEVSYDSHVKTILWRERILNSNQQADALRELIYLIMKMVE